MAAAKLYLYGDESLVVDGSLYLAVVVVMDGARVEETRRKLATIEQLTQRYDRKWGQTTVKQKQAYLELLPHALALVRGVYYRECRNGKTYVDWMAATVGDVAYTVDREALLYIKIDSYDAPSIEQVRKVLRRRVLHWKKLSGPRDESDEFLRLADTIAGLRLDVVEGDRRAVMAWPHVESFITKL